MVQKSNPTTAHKSPFFLSITPVAIGKKTTRKKFRCGYAALQALKDCKLVPGKHYGADVCDSNGVELASRDCD
jgi:hypothetical protein